MYELTAISKEAKAMPIIEEIEVEPNPEDDIPF